MSSNLNSQTTVFFCCSIIDNSTTSSTLSTLNEEHINCNLLDIILWIITTKAGPAKSELFCFILFSFLQGYDSKHNVECYPKFSYDRTPTQFKEEKKNNVNICIFAWMTNKHQKLSRVTLFCKQHARFQSETLLCSDATVKLFSQMAFGGSGPYLYPPPAPGSHCIPSDHGSRPLACCICSVKKKRGGARCDEGKTGDRRIRGHKWSPLKTAFL